ncbi:unnamed protein product, partial [Didymodactylos carnosus]
MFDRITKTSLTHEAAPLLYRPPGAAPLHDNRSNFRRRLAIFIILVSTAFERLAFYSLIGNLLLLLASKSFQWKQFNALTTSFIFLGTSYVSALFSAWLSDAKLGRAKTIIGGYIIYCIGYCIFLLFTFDSINKVCSTSTGDKLYQEKCSPILLSTLIVIALGSGAVQSNVAVFGAEQVQNLGSVETCIYFHKYYAVVNFGGFLALGIISYIQQNLSTSIPYGYIIPTGLLIIGAGLFICSYRLFIHSPPYDSVITLFIPVMLNAFRSKRKHSRLESMQQNRQNNSEEQSLGRSNSNSITGASRQIDRSINGSQQVGFIDFAKSSNGGKFIDRVVEDIKLLKYVIVVFLLLIPYWLIYFQ